MRVADARAIPSSPLKNAIRARLSVQVRVAPQSLRDLQGTLADLDGELALLAAAELEVVEGVEVASGPGLKDQV